MKVELDYTLTELEDRLSAVEEICEDRTADSFRTYELEKMADYLLYQMDKEERRERKILTPNRMSTVNKREVSFEGVVDQFEVNEDGIYGIMTNDKNIIMSPKVEITKEDIEEIPFLKQVRESIERFKKLPRRNYIVQQAIIDLSYSQYIIKDAYRQTMSYGNSKPADEPPVDWESILDFKKRSTILAIMKHYPLLIKETYEDVHSDLYWELREFEALYKKALSREPMLLDIVEYRFKELENADIRERLDQKYGKTFSLEHISTLYNNKIPLMIAKQAQENELLRYYTFEAKGEWKTCTQCGEVKLAHTRFFSRNSRSSRDGFYSICKECRNS